MESSSDRARRARAYRLYLFLRFCLALPAWVVVAVYLVREAKLDPLQLVLMGTVMEAAVFVFEIPTGVIADLVSRRLSLGIAWLLQGAAWALAGATTSFGVILVAWVVWGIGATFESGAFQAWVTDEVGVEGIGRVFVPPAPRGERSRRGAMVDTASKGFRLVRRVPVLLLLVTATVFVGAASEGFDRLSEAHFLRDVGVPSFIGFDPLWWFAVLSIGGTLLALLAANLLVERVTAVGVGTMARTLSGLTLLEIASGLLFALTGAFAVAVLARWLLGLARTLVSPVYATWVNRNIEDSSVRATVNSIANQADAIGEAAGGPVVGAIGNIVSLPAALATSSLFLLPTLGLYTRAARHDGHEPELAALPQPVETGA